MNSERYAEIEELIGEIRAATEGQSGFDDTFLNSVEAQLEAKGDLTDRQIQALENILAQWKNWDD